MEKMTTMKQGAKRVVIPAESSPHNFDPTTTVESIVSEALENSASKMRVGNIKAFIDYLKQGNSTAYKYYNYSLAKELGRVLGSLNKNIRAVYTHDFDDFPSEEDFCFENPSIYCRVRMIVWSERKTKALESLVGLLDTAMVQLHWHMLDLTDQKSILDIQFVDDEDVKNRTGYAAQIHSVHHAPIRVWEGNNLTPEI